MVSKTYINLVTILALSIEKARAEFQTITNFNNLTEQSLEEQNTH
jgi:hypothetical protein